MALMENPTREAVDPDMDGSIASNAAALGAARVLLGWMDHEEAVRVQQACRADTELSQAAVARSRSARERVAARRSGVDQRDVVTPLPKELDGYVEELRRNPATGQPFAEGWSPSLVDLRRLCALQSNVFTDSAEERVRGIDGGDVHSIAAVSLPATTASDFRAWFDPARRSWVITAPSPNLRIVGHLKEDLPNAATGLGFAVAFGHSFLSAIRYQGRYFLADGYHRSVAFLRRGITHVPGLVRTLRDDESLNVPTGMLPPPAYLGERPPQLADFLADDVAMSVDLPVFRKIILIQAIEVMA